MGPRTAAIDITEEVVIEVTDPLVRDHRRATVSALERSGPALQECAAWSVPAQPVHPARPGAWSAVGRRAVLRAVLR